MTTIDEDTITGRISRALKASAARITSRKIKRTNTGGGWQADAWAMYDTVGEHRFLADTLANRIGQAHLYVGRITDAESMAEPEPVEDGSVADVLGLLGTPSDIGQMLTTYGVNDFVAGEGYLVGVPSTVLDPPVIDLDGFISPLGAREEVSLDDLKWRYLSIDEVTFNSDSTVSLEWDYKVEVPTRDVFLIRVWRSHPRRHTEATSPTRANLPILRELVGLTMHVSAQIDSRLAGAGVLFVLQGAGQGGEDGGLFSDDFIDSMIAPIKDRGSGSAVVPYPIEIPDDGSGRAASDYIHYQTFSTPFDSETRALREEAIRRYALGADAPPELLLGVGGMNHWGAWLVQEDVITSHVTPPLARFADALTRQFLHPVLTGRGMSEEEAREYVVWYDVDHMVSRTNRTTDAITLFQAGAITAETLREEAGYGDDDAPETAQADPVVSQVLTLITEAPSLAMEPGIPALYEQVRALLLRGDAAPASIEPSDTDTQSDTRIPDTQDDAAPTIGEPS